MIGKFGSPYKLIEVVIFGGQAEIELWICLTSKARLPTLRIRPMICKPLIFNTCMAL